MLIERTEIVARDGQEAGFAAMMTEKALPMLRAVDGVVSLSFGRGIENPAKFLLLVEWRSMDDHAAFNAAAIHPEFVALFGPYTSSGAMEHFEMA